MVASGLRTTIACVCRKSNPDTFYDAVRRRLDGKEYALLSTVRDSGASAAQPETLLQSVDVSSATLAPGGIQLLLPVCRIALGGAPTDRTFHNTRQPN